ncbi:MAG: hypothetical protein AB1458_13890 [Bacteroidota bacterium]
MKNVISISMDMDWAPDEVVRYSLDILDRYGIRATLFMTNKLGIDVSPHEQGIHPNFTSIDFEKHIAERLDDFPGTVGSRSHSFFFTERFRPLYEKYGIEYDSNVMMYRQKDIHPYRIAPWTLEIPIFWMDNFYIEMEGEYPDYSLAKLDVGSPGYKVFDFHPVHVFLNTCSIKEYQEAKVHYHNPEELKKLRNTRRRGTTDLFVSLLEHIKASNLEVRTLGEISASFKISETQKISDNGR